MILATAQNYESVRGEVADRIGSELAIPLPEDQSRQDIFKFYVSKYPTQEGLNISKRIKASKGFTGANIERVVTQDSRAAQIHEDRKITQDDLWQALLNLKKEVLRREGAPKSPINFFEKNGKVILVMVAVTAIVSYSLSEKAVKMLFTKKKKSKKRVNQNNV